MKVKIRISILLCLTIFSLLLSKSVLAQTSTEALIAKLQEQIKLLQQQVTKLQLEVSSTKTELELVKTELKFTKALRLGTRGEEVIQLQEFLKQFPDIYPQGLVTGYFGPLTESAVRKFQEKQGIDSIGVVGPKTLSKLNELITEGAGKSDIIPPGLLIAPGVQKKLETPSTSSGQATSTTSIVPATTTPSVVTTTSIATTTPAGTTPATPATPATPTSVSGAPTVSATPAISATPANTASTTPTQTTTTVTISSISVTSVPESIGAYARTTFTWSTNVPADSRVEYTETVFPGSESQSTEMVTNHSIVTTLKTSTTYKYRVKSMASGNLAVSAEFTITTPARIDIVANPSDTTSPVISGLVIRRGLNNLDTIIGIDWNTNEPADNQVEYGLTTAYGSFTAPYNYTLETVQHNSIHAPDSDIGKTYHFRARSKDASGNLGVSGDYTVMVGKTAAPDTTPPVISNVRTENITTSGAQIKWTTNEPAGDIVWWDTNSAGSFSNISQARCTSGTNYVVTDHCINLTGFSSGTTYYYKVESGDPSSNSSISGVQQFTTTATASTATTTSYLDIRVKNLSAISQMLNSLDEILKQLLQLLK